MCGGPSKRLPSGRGAAPPASVGTARAGVAVRHVGTLLLVNVQLVLRCFQVEVFTESLMKGGINRLVTLQDGCLADLDRRDRQPNAGIPFFGPRQARWHHECVIAILFGRNAEEFGLVVVTR